MLISSAVGTEGNKYLSNLAMNFGNGSKTWHYTGGIPQCFNFLYIFSHFLKCKQYPYQAPHSLWLLPEGRGGGGRGSLESGSK